MSNLFVNLSKTVISLSRWQKYVILLSVDIILIPISILMTIWVWDPALLTQSSVVLSLLLIMTPAGLLFSIFLGLPRIKLNTYEMVGMQRTVVFAVLAGTVGALALRGLRDGDSDLRLMLVFTMTLILLSVSARVLLRSTLIEFYHHGRPRQRVLIYGAGQTGVQLAAALKTDDAVEPIAFIDDNPSFRKVTVAGLPVYPPVRTEQLVSDLKIDRVVLAMPSISRPKQARLVRHLQSIGCEVATLPSFAALVGEGKVSDRIEPLNPSEYLGREGLDSDLSELTNIYDDSCVMITGAGGSIGSELARQVLHCNPRKLILFEISEHALYQIDRELRDLGAQNLPCEIVPVLGSITDRAILTRIMTRYGVDTVLHAAAYKHVPLVECNRLAGLRNNVIGTRTLVDASLKTKVRNFILVSTDKAVHPTNIMGGSKRMSELLVQDVATRSDPLEGGTRFDIVRFGNVLGSSGSVVPLFAEQISRGGPITLTHAQVTRYFMTISEAARLVLLIGSQADKLNEQGQIYVLDMGKPILIMQLARQMIADSGYTVCDADNPQGDIEIAITGLRPGEKLHEELVMRGHTATPTSHPKILRVNETRLSEIEVAAALQFLKKILDHGDEDAADQMFNYWRDSPAVKSLVGQETIEQDAYF